MPPRASKASDQPKAAAAPLFLITGDDDFAVKARAKALFEQASAESGGFDHEIIDASASNSSGALESITKLREALQTLPFFGGSKVVWYQNCNFLGEERTASSQAVTEALAELSELFKTFSWQGVRLIITSPKVDKRKTFYKSIDKLGTVESYAGLSMDDRDWVDQAEIAARQQLRSLGKELAEDALSTLVANVGPNSRMLVNEIEKLSVFLGERRRGTLQDVEAIVSRNKSAKAFALADAVGSRDLPRLLRTLDQELWSLRTDSQKSEIGILYGIISKIRSMLFLKEMIKEGWINAGSDYNRFKSALEAIPAAELPQDRKFNPLAIHPYMLYNSLAHARNYSSEELVRAMELLLTANQLFVTSSSDGALVFQETLLKIVRKPEQTERSRA
jgi:DNA polymerase-3 subunit delta